MGWLSDVLGFEKFNFKAMAKQIKEDPERLFLGAADPVGSKLWGTILNKDWKDQPIVDQWGGASKYNYGQAEKAGINIKPGHQMHQIARIIASYYVGGYAKGKLGTPSGSNKGPPDPHSGGWGGWKDYAEQGMSMMPDQQSQSQQEAVEVPQAPPAEPDPWGEREALLSKANELRSRIWQLQQETSMQEPKP